MRISGKSARSFDWEARKNMRAFINTIVALCLLQLFTGGDLYAQFGGRIGRAIKKKAEDVVTRKAEEKTEETVEQATDPETYKNEEEEKEEEEEEEGASEKGGATSKAAKKKTTEAAAPKSIEMVYAKSDFVPGDEIFFDDDLGNEQMGEFPSQWDLLEGSAEVAEVAGSKCISIEPGGFIAPLMKDMNNYLPDVFTLEFDFWVNDGEGELDQQYELIFYDGRERSERDEFMHVRFSNPSSRKGSVKWEYKTPSNETRRGEGAFQINDNSWHHFAVSFNKRAFKAYINGIRIVNVPNMAAPKALALYQSTWGGINPGTNAITRIRLAKGAVPLYDRMMSDGKFITYGITFDVGKSIIRPESMGEINRIVKLMTENPDLKFSVEGHTDSTGSAELNQTLSDARSKAVVDKLVAMGIAADRLKAAGKGQSNPIADNATDEGRAKNRRVEFVKIN